MRLWVNDPTRPLIDAWVKSGNDTEHRGDDPPPRRPGLPDPAGVLQGQAGGRRQEERRSAEAGRAGRRSRWSGSRPQRAAEVDPGAQPVARPRSPEMFVLDDPVPARRPEHRLRARDVGLQGLGPGHDRRRHRDRRLRRRPTSASSPGVDDGDGRPRGEAPRVLPEVRRAGLPPAARATSRSRSTSTASSRRPATPRRPSSGSSCSS